MFYKAPSLSFPAVSMLLVSMILLLLPAALYSQQREKILISNDWTFVKAGAMFVEEVDLPHTWNDKDVLDETPGYFRGAGWYRKTVSLDEGWEEKSLFLEFEAASQVAEIFIDGESAGSHTGGYSGFRFNISGHLNSGVKSFELSVRVDNSFNPDIPPLTADFTFFGGIYRDVWLIYAPETHFSLEHFGGPGVYWQTPSVNKDIAELKIFGFVSHSGRKKAKYRLEHSLQDAEGMEVASLSLKQSFKPGKNQDLDQLKLSIESPTLWSVESPYTYSLHSKLVDRRTGELIDEVVNPVGFRWYEFSAEKGFSLNGSPMKIQGISRHQDYPGMGNALSREQHLEDIRKIKDMGANFLRIAHYPQDPDVVNTCDTIGLLASVEIPVVNRITESESFETNCLLMMDEMIWQNYNHPGIIMWTYMNEVLLRPPFLEDPARLEIYYSNVEALAKKLEQKARSLDPYRVTMIPNHGAFSRYKDVGLTEIPMIVGWNLYNGWYGSGFSGFGKFLDRHHAEIPDKPILVTEYGAGHDPRLSASESKRFDFTAEYAMRYHLVYIEEIEKRDFVSGGMIWALNDFSSEGRGDAVPHINSKGICDTDREPKESYWQYRAIWSKEPFARIWTNYPGILLANNSLTGSGEPGNQTVKIYTNIDSLRLSLNGDNKGFYQSKSGLLEALLPIRNGENNIDLYSANGEVSESLSFNFQAAPGSLNADDGGIDLHISCGDHRYLWDENSHELWLPDRPYTPGNWGHIGGESLKVKTRHGVKPSSDRQIFNTALDPLFQTQQVSPEAYQFDLPEGSYEIKLLFAELSSSEESENLAYNLGDDAIMKPLQKRVFSVEMNGNEVLKSANLIGMNGSYGAIVKSFEIAVIGEEGLEIKFMKEQGDPVISGIEVRSKGIR